MSLLIDGLIIIFYFLGITSIGLYMGRREKSLHDFALGGRRVPWWAVMAVGSKRAPLASAMSLTSCTVPLGWIALPSVG